MSKRSTQINSTACVMLASLSAITIDSQVIFAFLMKILTNLTHLDSNGTPMARAVSQTARTGGL